ncbi:MULTISPECIES: nuclear transport factor 2 family protein [unclassified Micromonospora]|uniref:nuclear transport factor 2 family protein n=1 Tax=unclassified Micromonospora TaxID=2617518 RepID=UPI001C21C20B|nr:MULTISPECIES: nuclear transport factor 2 family protein [unclassified Micromonospora]MBU8860527.1 nuclear transport factor 2 family protein [Micromonospora sp. WMMB482]MDM4780063.1 nuclear transport factor 2 family protein [Micromonospora sp. b486]
MDPPRPLTSQALLTDLYAAFNRRDIPTLLAAMAPDVSWPNGWEGGVVRGRDQVSAYWRRQWEQLDPVVTPTAFRTEADGRIAVTVHQVVHDKSGAKLADHTVTHVYRLDDGLVAAMEIRE